MPVANKAADKAAARKNAIQIIALIGVLILLLLVSVGSTLLATGVVKLPEPEAKPITYIYDAQLLCDQHIRDEFKDRLKASFVDDFSSRLDESTGIYKMFYEVSVKRDVNSASGVDKYFLNCFISGKGRLTMFDFAKDKAFVPKAGTRTSGHPFGLE